MATITGTQEQRTEAVMRLHRRQVRRQIILPAVVAFVVILILIPLAMLFAFSAQQIGIIAAFTAMLLLIPIVVLMLIPYVLLVMAVVGTGRIYRRLPGYLTIGRNYAHTFNVGTNRASLIVSRPIVGISRRLAWLERLSGHEPPSAR